jgi:hypothetical protein
VFGGVDLGKDVVAHETEPELRLRRGGSTGDGLQSSSGGKARGSENALCVDDDWACCGEPRGGRERSTGEDRSVRGQGSALDSEHSPHIEAGRGV